MIAAVAAQAEAVAIPFAPPLDVPLLYRTINTRPLRAGGEARVLLDQTLRFTRAGDTLHATLTAVSAHVDAPDRVRASIALLLESFNGHHTEALLDKDGGITGISDGASSWEAIRHSQYAAVAVLEANPAVSPAEKARARLLTADSFDLAPDARDARLKDSFAPLMAPRLPPLRAGETRRFHAIAAGPAGPLASSGSVTLVQATPTLLRVRIETRAEPDAVKGATEALLRELSHSPLPGAKTAAATAATMGYREILEAVLDRRTGLLVSSHVERRVSEGAMETLVESSDVTRIGATGTRIPY